MEIAAAIVAALCALALALARWLLYPARAGATARVPLFDRVALGFRLALWRALLVLRPLERVALPPAVDSSNIATGDAVPEDVVARFVRAGDVVHLSGFAATEVPAVWLHALLRLAVRTGGRDDSGQMLRLIIVSQTGASFRGVGSMSLDSLLSSAPRGTVQRLISGHLETLHHALTMRPLPCEIYNIPLGVVSRLVGLQAAESPSEASTAAPSASTAAAAAAFGPPLVTTVGALSYFDPRLQHRERDLGIAHEGGTGCHVTDDCAIDLVEAVDESPAAAAAAAATGAPGALRYRLPRVTLALVHARYCDAAGNVFFDENVTITDSIAAARAAKRNGGRVLVTVQRVVRGGGAGGALPPLPPHLMLRASEVDVVLPVAALLQRDVSALGRHCRSAETACRRSRGVLAGAAERSTAVATRDDVCTLWEEAALAWSYATTFHKRWRDMARDSAAVTHAHDEVRRLARALAKRDGVPVVRVIVGVSAPELVAMRLAESGAAHVGESAAMPGHLSPDGLEAALSAASPSEDLARAGRSRAGAGGGGEHAVPIQFAVESGVIGGLPAPGLLFGASFNPQRIMHSPAFWSLVASRSAPLLHIGVLGAGEVDVEGNVNVSRSGAGVASVIGCGGLPDIVDGVAYAIVFVLAFASKGTRFKRAHGASIVQRVAQVTFSPLAVLRRRPHPVAVRYCTELGVFSAELCAGGTATRLVAPSGLELLVQERCKVQLIPDDDSA
jgi:acyl CoA:acetate/3-ketoacid CoA transferase